MKTYLVRLTDYPEEGFEPDHANLQDAPTAADAAVEQMRQEGRLPEPGRTLWAQVALAAGPKHPNGLPKYARLIGFRRVGAWRLGPETGTLEPTTVMATVNTKGEDR